MIKIIMAAIMVMAFPPTNNSDWKPYEDYRCITDTTSPQYELLQNAEHQDNGLLKVNGRYAVAVGQNFGEVGDELVFVLETESGTHKLDAIICDTKRTEDSVDDWTGKDGHIIEAVVDTDKLADEIEFSGSVNGIPEMEGSVKNVFKIRNETR